MMQPFTGTASEWNGLIAALPDPHLLQTWEWSQVKAGYGWKPMPLVWRHADGAAAAAVMLMRRSVIRRGFAARLCILYASKGPLMDWANAELRARVLTDLQSLARREGAIFLKVDPDVVLGRGVPGGADETLERLGEDVSSELQRRGWKFSRDQIQFRNSVWLDLSQSEEQLLARMKQKTRYNVRLAEKKGVAVRIGNIDDLPLLYNMYAETSIRDGFVIRDRSYYETVWRTFMTSTATRAASMPYVEPLIAEVDREPVAAIFLFVFSGRAYYIYGMSRDRHREKMPAYLLQWEAIRRARFAGCALYDLWGAPEEFDARDGMWGVYRFKEGLGGRVVRTVGAWDFAPNPVWYGVYAQVMPQVLGFLRRRGRARTRESLE